MSHKITQVATYHIRSPRPNRLFVYLIIKQRLMINPDPTSSRKTRPWGLNQDILGGIQKRTAIRDATCSWEDSNFSSHRTQLPDNHRQFTPSKQALDPLSAFSEKSPVGSSSLLPRFMIECCGFGDRRVVS